MLLSLTGAEVIIERALKIRGRRLMDDGDVVMHHRVTAANDFDVRDALLASRIIEVERAGLES